MTNNVKRKILLTGAGVAGLATGAWLGWQRFSASTPATGAGDAALRDLWRMEFELPHGGVFKFSSLQGQPIVLNFWATWCPPCVEELPLLDSFYRENKPKGWQVIGLAVDNSIAVRKFLTQKPFSFPSPLAGLGGVDLSRSLGNLSGGLPFTVVINAEGSVALRHMGKLSAEEIAGFTRLVK